MACRCAYTGSLYCQDCHHNQQEVRGRALLALRGQGSDCSRLNATHLVNKHICASAVPVQVIPAQVLLNWDFTPQPVCSAAAEYLAAVAGQPLLCVPAANPGLYAR